MDLPPSNAMSADPYAFSWLYRELPVDNVCATTGAGFLRKLYAAVNVPWMSAWGSELQAALIAKAQEYQAQAPATERSAWLGVIRALQADLASQRTSELGHRFGIYVAYYRANNRRFDAISFAPGTTLLPWGVAPNGMPGEDSGEIVCIDPLHDTPFLFVGTPAAQAAARAQAESESATGIRVGDGRPVPPGQRTLPNPGVIGAVGLLAIGALGFGAWWFLGRSRDNPTYTRAQMDEWNTCREQCWRSWMIPQRTRDRDTVPPG